MMNATDRQNLARMIANGETVCGTDLMRFVLWNYNKRYTDDLKTALRWVESDLKLAVKSLPYN